MPDTAPLPAVLVTGGGTRIGAEIVKRFAAAGWHVVIHYKSSDTEARALAQTLPSAEIIACDLADDIAAQQMVADLASRLPDWRCLVNSASIFEYDDATNLLPATNRKQCKSTRSPLPSWHRPSSQAPAARMSAA